MAKPLELDGVEAEKAEAMRRYNNRKSFRNILRATAVASLFYLWFPTVAVSVRLAGDWFYRTGAVIVTNRTVVFVVANILVFFIFLLSRDDENDEESSESKPDLYDQFTSSSSAGIVTASDETEPDLNDQYTSSYAGIVIVEGEEDGDSKKQMVSVAIREGGKRKYRRTKSESVKEYRRTESVPIERMNSEEFQLRVETFIKEKKMNLIRESVVVQCQGLDILGGYGSC